MQAVQEANEAVETVRRYLRSLRPVIEAVESLPVEHVGPSLAIVAGIAQLLNERALTAYGAVREARGLAPVIAPFPDESLLRSIVAKVEPVGGGAA